MKVSISAVIITLNEERNIGRCLNSLQGVADEIVVVDSYSSDRTEEICRSHGARFIQHRFTGHIEQKNWAILQASHPFVLSLDADEALSHELRSSILEVKGNWTHDAYYFNRLTSYCGKWIRHTTWYPSRKLRLWDSRIGSWGGINPHDRFLLSAGATKKFLKGDLLHYSYYTISEHQAQINSFSSILAKSYYEEGRKAHMLILFFAPLWRFIRDYVIKLGFLDGFYGLVISVNSSHEVFLKYVKLRNIRLLEKRKARQVICFVNTQRTWGGGEKWNLDVMADLSRQGKQTMFISTMSSPLALRLKRLGIHGHELRVNRVKFLYPLKVFKYARIFRKEHVGVLVTNLSADMKTASVAARLAGVPMIIYRRGSAIPVENTRINRYIFRRILTRIIANSQETKRTILAKNPSLVPEDQIQVIYNGIQVSNFGEAVEPMHKREPGTLILGCAGRLSVEKGHQNLLEMLVYLKEKGIPCKLLLAGTGKLAESLRSKAKSLGVDQMVDFLGFVEDMPAFYNSLDIFLLPSHYEGFGYVLIEAMASRKPVVAFDVKSTSEIVEHGVNGYLVPPGQVHDMALRVMELAEDEPLCKRMGQQGRARVEELFSFERNRELIADFLLPPVP
jgi:glycosyltransferase involved in cell wall biosynthesis